MLRDPPLVSVILPVFNAAATVERAVASIGAQTLREWELIVVDDGSTDGTREVLERCASRDPRVRVLPRPHAGMVAALNAALETARSGVIARMDADDESYPDRLAEQLALLHGQPELGVVGCLVEFGGDRTASAGYALHVDWVNALITPAEIAVNRFVESPFAHPSVMFRREVLERYGGYRDGDFPEDYDLWLRWLDAGVRMAKVPRVLLRWNDPPARASRTDRRYDPAAFFRLKAAWIARWLQSERVNVSPAGNQGTALVHEARRIFVWGAGRPTRKRAEHLEEHGVTIAGYIDVDTKKTTHALGGTGRPVIPPAGLPPPGEIFVLGYVASRGARELVRQELTGRGYVEGRDFLMCA
jgi:glycosyltransferase involved in cell wall biosynthesis